MNLKIYYNEIKDLEFCTDNYGRQVNLLFNRLHLHNKIKIIFKTGKEDFLLLDEYLSFNEPGINNEGVSPQSLNFSNELYSEFKKNI